MTIPFTQKNRSRLPETSRLVGKVDPVVYEFINELTKTLKIRFESLENEVDVTNSKFNIKTYAPTAPFTIDLAAAGVHLIDPSGSIGDPLVVTLPFSLDVFNLQFPVSIKRINTLGFDVQLTAQGGELIEGSPTYLLPTGTLEGVKIVSNGTDFSVVSTV